MMIRHKNNGDVLRITSIRFYIWGGILLNIPLQYITKDIMKDIGDKFKRK